MPTSPDARDTVPGMDGGLRRHAAWLLVTLAYLAASPYYERLNNPNENVRVWATRAIVQHHVLNIDEVSREWGYVNDKAKNAWHVYSGKAPGVTFLGAPVLWVHTKLRALMGWAPPGKRQATFWLRLVAVKLPLAAFLFFFARHVERATRSPLARDLLVVALGLGTLMYPYGNLFVGHALAAAAAFSAFMLLDEAPEAEGGPWSAERGRHRTKVRLAGAGFLAAATVVLEYQAVLISAALAVYAAVRYRKRAATFLLGALPPTIALGAYHTALFGRPWRFPFGSVENPEFARTAHAAGFHGLTLPHASAFPAFLFSPAYGLFAFSPVLLVGVVGAAIAIARGGRARQDALLVTAICGVMFLFLAGMSNWRAGWCVGPRYITAVAPFLMLAAVRAWPQIAARWWGPALVAGLAIPSVVLNVLSGAVYPHYPEAFDNPVFDLTVPLVGEGYAPYGLGWSLGLRGAAALTPLAAIVVAALALAAAGTNNRVQLWARQLAVTVGVAAIYLGSLAAYGRHPQPEETRAAAFVRATWEPPRR
jgi:hypothetical protein